MFANNIVFFVVLASSIIQGPPIGLAAKRLGMDGPAPLPPAKGAMSEEPA